jgi:protein-disulfide isomerase
MRTRVWKRDPVVVPPSRPAWKGGKNAKVTILEFSEFECPWCRVGAQLMDKVLARYGNRVRLIFLHSPIPGMHPQSPMAAEATLCAQAQGKFWAMHDLLFQNQHKLSRADLIKHARRIGLDVARFTRELDSHKYRPRVLADKQLGRKKGVEALPTFFVNGQKVEGAVKFHVMKRYIDAELAP